MLAKIFIVIGSTIFGFLGFFHLFLTFKSNKFEARDKNVTLLMKCISPKITSETSMWQAWVGFNASHSIGAMLIAAFYVPLAIFHMDVISGSWWFSSLGVIVGFSYLFLAKKYWFRTPFLGILISTICFVVACILVNS